MESSTTGMLNTRKRTHSTLYTTPRQYHTPIYYSRGTSRHLRSDMCALAFACLLWICMTDHIRLVWQTQLTDLTGVTRALLQNRLICQVQSGGDAAQSYDIGSMPWFKCLSVVWYCMGGHPQPTTILRTVPNMQVGSMPEMHTPTHCVSSYVIKNSHRTILCCWAALLHHQTE